MLVGWSESNRISRSRTRSIVKSWANEGEDRKRERMMERRQDLEVNGLLGGAYTE